MAVRIHIGDCREVLKTLPGESVQCVVTSPPYLWLRDYGVEGQIGLESSPDEYIKEMVVVFRETRRVLRKDGTLWVNMGDSYSSGGHGGNPTEESSGLEGGQNSQLASMISRSRVSELPPKNIFGMPWRLAFALQADGWILRQDIIWSKPTCMPESVRDRCTKAHEYIFLLSKSQKYYFDADAIAEPCVQNERRPTFRGGAYCNNSTFNNSEGGKSTVVGNVKTNGKHSRTEKNSRGRRMVENVARAREAGADHDSPFGDTRNKRSVWTVATQPFSEAHFATFPSALVEPCILAGSPRGGVILDPFGGAGTTGLVAERLQRDSILIELNPEYAAMAERRIRNDAPMLADVRIA